MLHSNEVDKIPLEEYSILHFGSATAFLPGPLQDAYKLLLTKAIEQKKFISFDPNYRNLLFGDKQASFIEQSWYYLERCHFFKVSDEEAMLLTGCKDVASAAASLSQKTNAVFAITLGKDGTLLRHKDNSTTIGSISIKPVDTTGAGDAFVGALLYQLSNLSLDAIQALSTEEWNRLVGNSNKAGARTCEYMGAMEAFKHLSNDIFR